MVGSRDRIASRVRDHGGESRRIRKCVLDLLQISDPVQIYVSLKEPTIWDVAGNIVGYDAFTGKPLWHSYLGSLVSNAPETYSLDGHQYLLVAAGDNVYSFTLN